jgi:glutamyl-tRNA synthetase
VRLACGAELLANLAGSVPVMNTTASPRVRIAPAPSGFLHVGSVRTALYNWLYARRHNGTFVFRIEDTDADRATQDSMDSMLEAMDWIGLTVDEGVRDGGPYGPYRQSERVALHVAVARRLEEAGFTYRDHRTPDELQAFRDERQAAKLAPVFKSPAPGEVLGDPANPYVIRFALPSDGAFTLHDLVKGEVTWQWEHESDPVILRSNGAPTYPLANSVDDCAQGISLVCRGEDLLSVTPRQVKLYQAMLAEGLLDDALAEVGLPARDPSWSAPAHFAHLSMIVGKDRKKLSKRHGSVSIQEFERRGFLPGALRNYLALLGWSPGDGRERLTDAEMIEAFDFATVGSSAAAFDEDKLLAFNGERIREMATADLAELLLPFLDGTYAPDAVDADGKPIDGGDPAWAPLISKPATEQDRAVVLGLTPLVQERMQRLCEVQAYAGPFVTQDVLDIAPAAVKKVLGKGRADEVLLAARGVLAVVAWDAPSIEAALRSLTETLELGFGKVAQPVRVAVTGSTVSPPLPESVAIMAREVVLARIDATIPIARDAIAGTD